MPKKKTPKKPLVLPDDSSGTASPHEPIADDPAEQKVDEEHDSEQDFSFGNMSEHEANILVDRVENLYEKQFGILPDGQGYSRNTSSDC